MAGNSKTLHQEKSKTTCHVKEQKYISYPIKKRFNKNDSINASNALIKLT
jgi:hypothetical protein